ncbi:LCP family protein [Candidatus Microgenomates bacterium]|nr:LCP family protein [Candidatus Microgenomates bacterium]
MPATSKRKVFNFWVKFKPIFLVITLFIFLWEVFFFLRPVFDFAREHDLNPTFLWSLLLDKNPPLKKTGVYTNFLLLGIGGENHQASDLTDTMIFLSLDFEKKKTFLVSLPRDIWSPILQDKINSAYHYGEEKKEGGGLTLAKMVAEEVLGQPIHYAFLVDFFSFEKAINILGGVNVEIERSFDDFNFPIQGKENDDCEGDLELKCRYEHIHFEKGWEQMDGERALKYVRSRNAEGEEGSDFARAARQQRLLLAFKDKVLSREIIFNSAKIKQLAEILSKGIEADINLAEACFLGKFVVRMKQDNIEKLVLEEDLFITPPLWEYGKWVLVPSGEDFTLIHEYIEEKLNSF